MNPLIGTLPTGHRLASASSSLRRIFRAISPGLGLYRSAVQCSCVFSHLMLVCNVVRWLLLSK